MQEGLKDPLAVVRTMTALEQAIAEMGLTIVSSGDFQVFSDLRKTVRKGLVSPMFDTSVNVLDDMNSFWIEARDQQGNLIALQACRRDYIDRNLAEWVPRWMGGLYLLRSELIIPTRLVVPANSITHRLQGPGVYHGEVWIDRDFRNAKLCGTFVRIGMIVSLIKWQPNVIWGLTSGDRATRGLSIRMGYPHAERGFLKWDIPPHGADVNEVITIATRSDLEYLAHERIATLP